MAFLTKLNGLATRMFYGEPSECIEEGWIDTENGKEVSTALTAAEEGWIDLGDEVVECTPPSINDEKYTTQMTNTVIRLYKEQFGQKLQVDEQKQKLMKMCKLVRLNYEQCEQQLLTALGL